MLWKKKLGDLESASAGDLARAVGARKFGALELADAAISRIEKLDGSINAVVVRDFDRARDQAKAIDKAVERGERWPLMGVPMTVKEVYDIAGLPTTFGFEAAKNLVPSKDAVAVARLKAAGAVILGKTNIAMGLADWQSDNPLYGRTKNPLDLTRTPGGSSGGSAAALAAGMVPLELGGDAGGSIRVPSSFCGVFGHLSTFGLISLEGHGPPGGGIVVGRVLGAAGPMARNAEDLDLALGVLAGPAGREATGYKVALPPPRHALLADFRVLMLPQHPMAATDNEIVTALDQLASRLEKAGVAVAYQSSLLPDLAAAHATIAGVFEASSARTLPLDAPQPPLKRWFDLLTAQEALRRQWDTVFQSFDVVIAPCFGTAAFTLFDEPNQGKRALMINGVETSYKDQSAWPGIATLPNLPATAAPIGRTKAGLPLGAQIVGPYLEDRTTIAFARLISERFDGDP